MKTTAIAGTTKTEAEVLAATAAAVAAGQDPFGDDGDDDAEQAAADASEDDDGPEAAAAEVDEDHGDEDGDKPATVADLPDDDAGDAAPAATKADAAPVASRYKVGDPASTAAEVAGLRAEKAKALKDLMDGVIDTDDYSAIEASVSDKLEALTVRRALHEANVQTEQASQASALDALMVAAKKAGEVDYATDVKAAKQFDAAMAMLAEPGDTRSYAEQVADAHRAVLAIRGTKASAPAPKQEPAAAAQPRENGKGPMTLRNVPAAQVASTGGGWQEHLASLSGQEYEDAFSRLTPAQRAQLLND